MQDIFQPIVVWWKYQNVYSEAPISVFYEFVEISKKSYWSEEFCIPNLSRFFLRLPSTSSKFDHCDNQTIFYLADVVTS